MKTLLTLAAVLVCVVTEALHVSFATNLTAGTAHKEVGLTSQPVTNESVEEGLRKNREALRTSPEFQTKNVTTHIRLAEILSQQGDPNGAIEEYQAALRLNPSLSEGYRELGAVYIDKHEWEKAEQVLVKGIKLNPQDHQALYWLGRSLMAQNQCIQASQALRKATLLGTLDSAIFSDLGLALMAQGHINDAEQALRQAIHLQPDFAEAHHRIEEVRNAKNNTSQLIQSARSILQTLFRRE